MTSDAKLMPDDMLASMRREGSEHGLSRRETLDLLSHVDALTAECEEMAKALALLSPDHGAVGPKLASAGPTRAGQDAAAWIVATAVRCMFAEIQLGPPEKRNRLSIGVSMELERWTLTLAKGEYESAMEVQRDAARRERDILVGERDVAEARASGAEAKLAALVESVPAGTTVLCVAMVDACTSCGELAPESPAEDRCPSCGAEWCMTTYVGDPTYCVTHTELGNPKCLDTALRAARGEP